MSLSELIRDVVSDSWVSVFEPKPATLHHYTGSTGTGIDGPVTPTYADIVVYPITEEYHDRDFDGVNVKQGDRKLWLRMTELDAAGIRPSEDDRITVDGTLYGVMKLLPVKPMGTDILFGLQVRK